MGLRDRIRRLRIRTRRAWRDWRGGSPARLRRFDDLDEDEQAELKRQMMLTWEQMNGEMREVLMNNLVEDVEEGIEELNASLRGGNGHD